MTAQVGAGPSWNRRPLLRTSPRRLSSLSRYQSVRHNQMPAYFFPADCTQVSYGRTLCSVMRWRLSRIARNSSGTTCLHQRTWMQPADRASVRFR